MHDFKAVVISGELYNDDTEIFACLSNASNTTATPHSESTHIRWIFIAPVIFWVGVVGNALILAVMTQRWMRGTSTSSYLIAMAIADLCVLVTGMIPEWLEANGFVTLKELHPAACKIEKFLFYTSGDAAIWIRVLFTLDRFVAVCFPMSTTECCVYWKAKYYSLGALAAAAFKNLHVFWTRGGEYTPINQTLIDSCLQFFGLVPQSTNSSTVSFNVTVLGFVSNCGGTTAANKYFESFVRPWIAFSLVSVLPFCIIVTCNLLIILSLVRVKRSTRAGPPLVRSSHEKHIVQLTAMCLSASFCFLVCVTPSIILLIGKPYWAKDNHTYDVAKAINNQLYYVVHSANFFLYCITGKRFRDTLVHICSSNKRKLSFASSVRSSSYSASLMARRSVQLVNRISNPTSPDYFKVSAEQKEVVSSL